MSKHEPKQFKMDQGVDAYNPDLVDELLSFLYLNNVEPRLGRLFASKGYELFQNLTLTTGERIVSFGFYQLSNRQFYNLYAFSDTSVYWFDFSTQLFNTTAIYTGFHASAEPYVLLKWFDALYVTKLYSPYVKLERKNATVISGAPYARYGIIANSHAYLAAVGDEITNQLARIRWSDLEDPESWEFNPNESEADFFDLEPDSRQITGLSYQRGSPIVYCENNIWAATPVGFPGGFRHDPLFPGIGNIFHNAVVSLKEIDFFIGADNFYQLNGLQLVPIGDQIFERFIADVKITSTTSVLGCIDSRKSQVFWVYIDNSSALKSVVYNYKEQKWSERDPQSLSCWFDTPRVTLRGYDAIDDVATVINSDAALIDDPAAGYPVVLPQLVGSIATGKKIGKVTDVPLKIDGAQFAHNIETFDFFFESPEDVKEITKVLLAYTGVGTSNITVSVGTRKNQSDNIAWSATKSLVNQAGVLAFFTRSIGVGHYLRFKLAWNNTNSAYLNDLRLLSLVKVEDDGSVPEK